MKVVLKIEESDLSGLRVWDKFAEKLNRLVDAGYSEIVLDFEVVHAISSLALGSIVASSQTMASAGRRLTVINLNEELTRLARHTKLLELISVQ